MEHLTPEERTKLGKTLGPILEQKSIEAELIKQRLETMLKEHTNNYSQIERMLKQYPALRKTMISQYEERRDGIMLQMQASTKGDLLWNELMLELKSIEVTLVALKIGQELK